VECSRCKAAVAAPAQRGLCARCYLDTQCEDCEQQRPVKTRYFIDGRRVCFDCVNLAELRAHRYAKRASRPSLTGKHRACITCKRVFSQARVTYRRGEIAVLLPQETPSECDVCSDKRKQTAGPCYVCNQPVEMWESLPREWRRISEFYMFNNNAEHERVCGGCHAREGRGTTFHIKLVEEASRHYVLTPKRGTLATKL
jgi:hypothetical protein